MAKIYIPDVKSNDLDLWMGECDQSRSLFPLASFFLSRELYRSLLGDLS